MKLKTVNSKSEDIVNYVAKFVKSKGRLPTTKDLSDSGYGKKLVEYHFLNLQRLYNKTRECHPEAFKKVFTPEHFTDSVMSQLRNTVKKYKTIVVTTAVPSARVNKNFLQSIKNFCAEKKALLLIQVSKGNLLNLDPVLINEHIVFGDIWLNQNLKLWHVNVPAESPNPAAAFAKYTSSEGSFLIPSPKQLYKPVPTMSRLPRAVITSGAITEPNYPNSSQGAKAHEEHFVGAYIIELDNNDRFYPRNIQALSDGSFADLGILYSANKKPRKLHKTEILRVDGDHHVMEIDPIVKKVQDQMQREIPAWCNVSHDTWSQKIENHHDQYDYIKKAQQAEYGELYIEKERVATQAFLAERAKQFDVVTCVSSNHNDALAKFNKEGRYLESSPNWKIGHILSLAQFHKIHPVEFAINYYDNFISQMKYYFGNISNKKNDSISMKAEPLISNLKFLKEGESFKFGGFELGFHGSGGAGGARGTPDAMRLIHSGNAAKSGGVVTGHTHQPMLYNRSAVVGTSTSLPHQENAPDYVRGQPNAWMNTVAFVYQIKGHKMGSVQLVSIIDGKYKR